MNGQLLNPSAESSSTRRPSNVEFVPMGEVKKICKFPWKKTLNWTFYIFKVQHTSIFHSNRDFRLDMFKEVDFIFGVQTTIGVHLDNNSFVFFECSKQHVYYSLISSFVFVLTWQLYLDQFDGRYVERELFATFEPEKGDRK